MRTLPDLPNSYMYLQDVAILEHPFPVVAGNRLRLASPGTGMCKSVLGHVPQLHYPIRHHHLWVHWHLYGVTTIERHQNRLDQGPNTEDFSPTTCVVGSE